MRIRPFVSMGAALAAVLAVTFTTACTDAPSGPDVIPPEAPVPSFLVASPSAMISGTTGEIVDPVASSGGFCLRYTGDPPPPGDFSHVCQWGTPYLLTANPEDGPVTFEGTIDVSAQDIDNAALIGLIDHDDLEDGLAPNGWLDGAYIYILRQSATQWKIGPSDGSAPGGEIIQKFIQFTDTDVPDGILNVTFTIDGTVPGTDCSSPAAEGCLTLHLMGGSIDEELTDGYGEVVGSNSADPEFSNGGIPGWDDEEGARVSNVHYDLTVGPLVIGGEPADPATKDECKNGGWEDFGFANQGQCIRFVNTGKDSRGEFAEDGKGKKKGKNK